MTKTLDDLEKLLTARGYPCKRILDVCVLTQLPTKAYTSLRTGTKSIEVQLAFDDRNHCLTMDTPWAFDSRQAVHKEAMLACLLAASGKSPLVKTQLDPEEGEVRLRVDCRLGADGVDGDDLIAMLGLIPAFADRWYPHIKDAMEKGLFDAAGSQRSPNDERLESLARRCGGVNRIEALLRQRTRGPKRRPEDGRDPTTN
jgi:hypothetical protein